VPLRHCVGLEDEQLALAGGHHHAAIREPAVIDVDRVGLRMKESGCGWEDRRKKRSGLHAERLKITLNGYCAD
jgi:hypothetical protein